MKLLFLLLLLQFHPLLDQQDDVTYGCPEFFRPLAVGLDKWRVAGGIGRLKKGHPFQAAQCIQKLILRKRTLAAVG